MRKAGIHPQQIPYDPRHQIPGHSHHATTKQATIRSVRRRGRGTVTTEIVKGTVIGTGIVTEIGNEIVREKETEIGTTITGIEMTVGHLKTDEERYETVIGTENATGIAEEITTALIQFTRKKRKNVWRGWATGRNM